MSDDFVHLHTHSHNSAFDGLGKPNEFCEKAAEMGQPAIALTEHGSLRGLYEASNAAESAGVKLIPGAELYLADDASKKGLSDEEKLAIRERYAHDEEAARNGLKLAEKARRERDHVTVWAVNDEGLRNLYRLTAWSWGPGYYFKPRVDLDRLIEHSEGLAVSSGCPNGVVAKLLRDPRGTPEALSRARRLAEAFGDRFVVEIMPHVPEDDCSNLAHKLVRLADSFGATLIATQDAHYPHEHDAEAQEALLCIHTRSKMDDKERFKFDAREYWLTSRPELESAFRGKLPTLPPAAVSRALDNTVAFAERCTAKIARPKAGAYLVAPALPPEFSSYGAWLTKLCVDGARDRLGYVPRAGTTYGDRLLHELRTILDMDFTRYFIAVWEVRAWSRSVGILCGPGRGSGAGSLVCYLLRITDLDPIAYGLSFERFLAPGRVDLPDIDLDFQSTRRQEVITHLRELYGHDHVAHISTHNVLGGKRAARDLARIFNVPEKEAAAVAALVSDATEEETRTEDTLVRVLKDTDVGRAFADRYPDVVAVAGRLEGQLRDVGLHAAGVVMSSVPLADIVPLETRTRKKADDEDDDGADDDVGRERVVAVAYDMKGVEAVGLVKMDVLGLTTLSMLDHVFAATGRTADSISLNDPDALQGFTDGRFSGVFQYDTPSARRLCRGFVFKDFSDVAVFTALNRPGPMKMGLASMFIDRSIDPSKIHSVHPIYDEVMKDTLGVPVYQEQIVALARGFGYTPAEADKLRKKIGKKLGLSDEESHFVDGATKAGMAPYDARKLFDSITAFGAYAFNKSHAYCYGALSLWCMYLKVHAPAEFFAAALQFKKKPDVQMRLASEARRCGIEIRPPDVNLVGASGFRVHYPAGGPPEILGAIGDLKGIGDKTASAIAKNAPYTSLVDFKTRTRAGRVTVRTFEILAQAGALRSLCASTRFLAVNARAVWEHLAEGLEPVLDVPLPALSESEEAEMVGAVWPIFAGVSGQTAFDAVVDRAREKIGRPILIPGDEALRTPGPHFVIGLMASIKLFPDDRGGRTGRVILTSADGEELPVRADPDALDASSAAFSTTSHPVIAVVWTSEMGNCALERAWSALPVLDGKDPTSEWLVSPARTKPRDPWAALMRTEEGHTFEIQGQIVRLRNHSDKSGGRMATFGLMAQTGYIRVLVFSYRAREEDARALAIGRKIKCRVKKLDGGGVCLADAPLTDME